MKLGKMLCRVRDLLFPRKCVACGVLLDWYEAPQGHAVLCLECLAKWEKEQEEPCGICGKPVIACACMTEEMEKAKCHAYRKLVYYRHATTDAVQNRVVFYLKRVRDAEAPAFLAERLLPALQSFREQSRTPKVVLTYVPRPQNAKLEHGVDQAERLARALSRLSGSPVKRLLLRNRGKHRQQKTLSATARVQNARESFCIAPKTLLDGTAVILIDDVVTTGASASACVRLLRRAGAECVFVLSVASDDVNRDRK